MESVYAATEENNKKNATNDCPEQRTLIETDMNFSVPDLSSTNKTSLNILSAAQSSPNINLSTPISINLADIPVIDDESSTSKEQQQPPKQSDDTSSSEDDDEEQTQLKRLKANSEQIEAPVEEDDEEDEEEQQEEVCEDLQDRRIVLLFLFRRKKSTTKNYKNNFMVNNKKSLNAIGMMISFSNGNSLVKSHFHSFIETYPLFFSPPSRFRWSSRSNEYQRYSRYSRSNHHDTKRR